MNLTATAKHSILRQDGASRAMGRLTSLRVFSEPEHQGEIDLLADTFHALYQHNPVMRDPNPERVANHKIMEWAMGSQSYRKSKAFTTANRAAAKVAASTLWEFLRGSDVYETAMREQEEIEKKQQEASEKRMEAGDIASEGGEGLADLLKQIADMDAEIAADAAALQDKLDQAGNSPVVQGIIAEASQEAGQEGEKVSALTQAMGMGDAEMSDTEADQVIEIARQNSELINTMAEFIGRLKGVAMRAGEARDVFSGNFEVGLTQELDDVWDEEIAMLVGVMGAEFQMDALDRYVNQGGLAGWTPQSDQERRGVFTAMIDESGSMQGLPYTIAKALGIGLASVAETQGRAFKVNSFGGWNSQVFRGFTDESPPSDRAEWLTTMISGGTNFSGALKQVMRDVLEIERRGHKGTDALFITDDEGRLDPEVVEQWQEFKSKHDVRLLSVVIGNADPSELRQIADKVLPLSQLTDGETIAREIGKWLAD